jgi:hypothetical protein
MDDTTPHGSATEPRTAGHWDERLQAPPAPPPPAPKLKDSKGPPKRKDDRAVKDAGRTWAAGMKAVGKLKARGDAHPYAGGELTAALARIKAAHGFSVLEAKPAGEYWAIAAALGTQTLKKPLRIKRAPENAAHTPGPTAPSLPERTFDAGGEHHRIFIVLEGTRAIPMISSEAQRVKEFLRDVPQRFADDQERSKALAAAKRFAAEVDRLANEVEVLVARGAAASAIEAKRSSLGDQEKLLADNLHVALGGVNIARLDRGYVLEGVVGTYGTVPEQRRDRLTPDHQPQDSLMKFASGLDFEATGRKLFAGTRLGRYATNDGWAINLHHQRHVWGRTYGRQPDAEVVSQLLGIATQYRNEAAARRAVIDTLRDAVDGDAKEIEKHLKEGDDHDVWSDLKAKIPGKTPQAVADRAALRGRIVQRVTAGEQRMRQQPLADFLKP